MNISNELLQALLRAVDGVIDCRDDNDLEDIADPDGLVLIDNASLDELLLAAQEVHSAMNPGPLFDRSA